jgi:glycosyltransferase involved in cell wall biosynthesis
VIHFDTVNEKQLLALYKQAAMLAYPSFYEGFGLPVLEAMACGTPVLASHAASMPEVLGDAGILLDPNDLQGWTETIIDLVNNNSERERLGTLGHARSKEFTWERAARATLDVYRRVYGT